MYACVFFFEGGTFAKLNMTNDVTIQKEASKVVPLAFRHLHAHDLYDDVELKTKINIYSLISIEKQSNKKLISIKIFIKKIISSLKVCKSPW